MKIIKKYKSAFYDTEDKIYISSQDLMGFIAEGIAFKVIKAVGQEDLTAKCISNALRNHYKGNAVVDAILMKMFKETLANEAS